MWVLIWNIAKVCEGREKCGPGSSSEVILVELKRSSVYDAPTNVGIQLYCFRRILAQSDLPEQGPTKFFGAYKRNFLIICPYKKFFLSRKVFNACNNMKPIRS